MHVWCMYALLNSSQVPVLTTCLYMLWLAVWVWEWILFAFAVVSDLFLPNVGT